MPMVAVSHAAEASAPQAVAAWLDTLRGVYPDEDLDAFEAALAYARERCGDAHGRDGEPLIDRALGTATILAALKLDAGTVRAALLTGLAGARRVRRRGRRARASAPTSRRSSRAWRGWTRSARSPPQGDADERAAQAERLRKMLLAMVEDIRVVLIKLAERTAALRFLMTGGAAMQRAAAARRARGARPLRAARQPARRLAAQVGARGPVACARSSPRRTRRSRRMLDERRLDRAALHRGRDRARSQRELAAAGIARRGHRPAEAHLQHLEQDAPQAARHRRAVRHPRGAHPRRRRQGLLHGARHRPSPVDAAAARVRRLHREAQGQQLPLAAHRGDRPRGQAARGADPHARDAPALRVRRRRALALQGGRAQGRAPRSRVRGPDRVAAAGARLEGRGRRRRRVARRVQEQPLHRHDLRADAAGQGRRPAARRDAGRLRVRGAHEPRPSLPRRARRRRDGAAQHALEERPAGRDHRGEAGRPVARLAQSRARLRAQPSRARQGAAVVQGAAARGDARAGPRDRRARAAARRRDRGQSRRGRGEGRLRARPRSSIAAVARDELNIAADPDRDQGGAAARRGARSRSPTPDVARAAEQGRRARAAASSSSASIG